MLACRNPIDRIPKVFRNTSKLCAYYIGGTKNKQIKKECTHLKRYAKVLEADYNPSVKFVNRIYKILGIKNTIRLLAIYNKIR